MVVGIEIGADAGNLLRREILFQQPAVDPLSSETGQLLFELSDQPVLFFLPLAVERLDIQLADDVLHRNIAGKIPDLRVDLPAYKKMPENAVQCEMKIIPRNDLPRLAEAAADMQGVVVQKLPVRCDLRGDILIPRYKADQGGFQKAKMDEQRIA